MKAVDTTEALLLISLFMLFWANKETCICILKQTDLLRIFKIAIKTFREFGSIIEKYQRSSSFLLKSK